jgi:hypothetical protein
MPSSDTRATRRSVLRTTGAAAVGALGATSSATAASCQTGESFYTFDAAEVCNPNGDSAPLYDTCDAVDQVADVPTGSRVSWATDARPPSRRTSEWTSRTTATRTPG